MPDTLKICARCFCHYRESQGTCPHCRGQGTEDAGEQGPASLLKGLDRAGGRWGTAGTLVLLAAMMGSPSVSCGTTGQPEDGTPAVSPDVTGTPVGSPDVTGTAAPTPSPTTTGIPVATPSPTPGTAIPGTATPTDTPATTGTPAVTPTP